MKIGSRLTAWACALSCALLLSVAPAMAYAVNAGDCGTPEQLTARFQVEGQHSFASADEVVREKSSTGETMNRLYGAIVTINADLSVGYIVLSDRPSNERATKLCVYLRLADLRLFDARKPGLQGTAMLRASNGDAARHCAQLVNSKAFAAKTCGAFNDVIGKGEPNGERIMLEGFNVERQADGSYKKDGTLTTVTGNVTGSLENDPGEPLKGIVAGVFYTSLPDGATIINKTLVYAHYTPYGISLLDHAPAR
jgi:hypothetical protein